MFVVMIIAVLMGYSNAKGLTVKFKDAFNPFKETNLNDLKVVIVSQDPYPHLGVSDGLAFSCSNTSEIEKSLQYILKEITGRTEFTSEECNLARWAHQGVLLINTSFTCEINKIGSHQSIWKAFADKNIIFVLMGRKAESWQLLLNGQIILTCPHPASAAYNNDVWNADGIFKKINKELDMQGKTCISW